MEIGKRERRAKSILDVDSKKDRNSFSYNHACQLISGKTLRFSANPYDNGGATNKIIKLLETHDISNLLDKRFHDLDFRKLKTL